MSLIPKNIAPVLLINPSGKITAYGYSATSDAGRGAALTAAYLAATSGCLIINYGDAAVDNLGKNGVNLYNYGRIYGASSNPVITDGGTAQSFWIEGPGRLETTGSVELVRVSHASSNIRIKQYKLDNLNAKCITISAGALTLEFDEVSSGADDCIYQTGGSVTINKGRLISTGGYEINTSAGNCYVRPGVIYSNVNTLLSVLNSLHRDLITIPVFAADTNVATGDGKAYFFIPAIYNGFFVSTVAALVFTAGTTGTTDIQIARVRSGTPADILTTKLTIDSTETGTDTAATPAVIGNTNRQVLTNDRLRIDVDAISTTPPQGLIVTIGLEQ